MHVNFVRPMLVPWVVARGLFSVWCPGDSARGASHDISRAHDGMLSVESRLVLVMIAQTFPDDRLGMNPLPPSRRIRIVPVSGMKVALVPVLMSGILAVVQ